MKCNFCGSEATEQVESKHYCAVHAKRKREYIAFMNGEELTDSEHQKVREKRITESVARGEKDRADGILDIGVVIPHVPKWKRTSKYEATRMNPNFPVEAEHLKMVDEAMETTAVITAAVSTLRKKTTYAQRGPALNRIIEMALVFAIRGRKSDKMVAIVDGVTCYAVGAISILRRKQASVSWAERLIGGIYSADQIDKKNKDIVSIIKHLQKACG